MKHKVFLLPEAENDIVETYKYIARSDSIPNAESIYQRIEEICLSLSEFPNRGHIPPELERIHIYDYREVHCPPYRIIYQVHQSQVFIHSILDGRRDIQELLEQRLLRR